MNDPSPVLLVLVDPGDAPPPDPPRPPPSPPRPAVLPGSRWLQRASSGHGTQTCGVIRVGERSITFVMEGNGKGGGSHKSGRKYTVPVDAFLKNHTLLSQPSGYQEGDEHLPDVPKTDTLQTYFQRRARFRRFTAEVDGADVRTSVSDLFSRALVLPREVSRATPIFPPTIRSVAPPTPPVAPPATPAEEPPVSTPQAARHEPVANPVIPPQQADQVLNHLERLNLANPKRVDLPPPAPEPDVFDAPPWAEPVSPYTEVMDANDAPDSTASPTTEAVEVDPMEQFMESGRILIDGLNARIAVAQAALERLQQAADDAALGVERLTRQKDRIEAAVLAAIASTGEPEPAPPPDPPGPQPAEFAEARTVTTVAGTPRLMGPAGFVADPAKGSQRDWVLNRFDQFCGLVIQDVCDEFAQHFGMSRERGIKAISSIMGRQIQNPNPRWSHAVRVESGVYKVAP